MRYIILALAVLIVSCSLAAQVGLNVTVNLDRQPAWGPTGFDHVEYYYLPGIEAYYNVPQEKFIYREGSRWIVGARLPSRYDGYDFYKSYKVVVNDPKPYLSHETYRVRYLSYKDRRDQESIRDSRDSRYFVNRGHPQHDAWVRQHGDNDRGRDYDRDRRDGRDGWDNGRSAGSYGGFRANIYDQPAWGPTGYDYVQYYYFPSIQAYYNVPQRRFIYRRGGRWVVRASLPGRYRNFDFYRSYKVVVNDRKPYLNHDRYRDRYSSWRDRRDQESIRDSRDAKYYVSRDHPEHNNWERRQRDNDRDGRNEYDDDRDRRDDESDRDGGRFEGSNDVSSFNIGEQPAWGPTGYDRADYYYIPDINVYYSVSQREYTYWDGGAWRNGASLPSTFGNFDPYVAYKVVINERDPSQNNNTHRTKYASFRGTRGQPMIRDSRDSKYFVNKDHPEHANWIRERRR